MMESGNKSGKLLKNINIEGESYSRKLYIQQSDEAAFRRRCTEGSERGAAEIRKERHARLRRRFNQEKRDLRSGCRDSEEERKKCH